MEDKKVIYNHVTSTAKVPDSIKAGDLDIGAVGLCVEIGHSAFGHHLMRGYDVVVDLNNPHETWEGTCKLSCVPLKMGTKIELVMGWE